MAKRVQRQRTKGWRKPEGAVYVGRGSKWGNPYRVSGETTAQGAVELFSDFIQRAPLDDNGHHVQVTIRAELAGKDLMCWCPNDRPCHADVLLELANEGEQG